MDFGHQWDTSQPHSLILPQQKLLSFGVEVNFTDFNGETFDLCEDEKRIRP